MNKRDAQQHLVAYKDNQREKEYALQHGVLSNFKAKYLEKIPLGNGKFRYIYEEAKDKVSSAAKNVANNIKTAVNPGAMTENEKSIRSSTNQARADVKEANARKAAIEEINRRATTNAQSPNAADARMQFAKQAVAENDRKNAEEQNKSKVDEAKRNRSEERLNTRDEKDNFNRENTKEKIESAASQEYTNNMLNDGLVTNSDKDGNPLAYPVVDINKLTKSIGKPEKTTKLLLDEYTKEYDKYRKLLKEGYDKDTTKAIEKQLDKIEKEYKSVLLKSMQEKIKKYGDFAIDDDMKIRSKNSTISKEEEAMITAINDYMKASMVYGIDSISK